MLEANEITKLLARITVGDTTAEAELLPIVYQDLRQIAVNQLRSEQNAYSMQATALVNELYLRIGKAARVDWKNRTHFFRVSARVMRHILIDYARQHQAQRRGEGVRPTLLEEGLMVSEDQLPLVIEVHDVLEDLQNYDDRLVQVVEMRFFAGMTDKEMAAALDVSEKTVQRYWNQARAWLHEKLSKPPKP